MSATTLRAPLMGAPFLLFVAAATCAFAGAWMATPLAAVLLAGRGVEATTIGLYAAAVWGAAMLAAPLTPVLSRLAGGALALHRLAVGVAVLGLAGLGTDPALPLWFACGAVVGVGTCLTWTTADAVAAALAPPGREGRSLGLYQTFVSAAIGGGPAVLLLTGVVPAAFWGAAAILLLGLVLGAGLREPEGAVPPRLRLSPARLRPVLGVMLAPAGAAALCGALEAAAGSVFPVQGLALGMTAAAAAAIVVASGFGNMLAQYPLGRLADRWGPAPAIALCGLAVAAAAVLWPSLAPGWGAWPALALWGGASGAIYTLGMVRAVQRLSGAPLLWGIAGLNTAYLLGGALGAPLAGLALDALPAAGLPLILAALALGGTAMIARAVRG